MFTFRERKPSIRVTVVFVFIISILITASATIGLQYFFTTKITENMVTSYAEMVSSEIQDKVVSLNRRAIHAVETLGFSEELRSDPIKHQASREKEFINLLANNSAFYSIYIALQDDSFHQIINLDASPHIRANLNARLTDKYARVTISGEGSARKKITQYLNEKLDITHQTITKSTYKPTSRNWFKNASQVKVSQTKPYLFQNLQASGKTYSKKIAQTNNVIGIDITLSTMSNFLDKQLEEQEILKNGEILLFDSTGKLIVANKQEKSISTTAEKIQLSGLEREYINNLGPVNITNEKDWAPLDYSVSGEPRGYFVDLTKLLGQKLGLEIKFVNGHSWSNLVNYFINQDIDILTPVYKTSETEKLGYFSTPIATMNMSLVSLDNISQINKISDLNGKKLAVPFGWSISAEILKHYPEIELIETSGVLQSLLAVKNGKAYAAIGTETVTNYTIKSYFLSGFKTHSNINLENLYFPASLHYVYHDVTLKTIFDKGLASITEDETKELHNKWIGGNSSVLSEMSMTVPYPELIALSHKTDQQNALNPFTVNGSNKLIYVSPLNLGQDRYMGVVFDKDTILQESREDAIYSIIISMLFVALITPISWLLAEPIVRPIKKLVEENKKITRREFDKIKKVDSSILEINQLSQSQLVMARQVEMHHEQQTKLLDSFVEVIAQAIDDKSKYTGGHCHRVPELAMMVANSASESQSEFFSNFSLSEDGKREFKLAAWLHDCGKITTAEHIVDKATKLETNYNRIHEIRTRFEVLWRDAIIETLIDKLADKNFSITENPILSEIKQKLDSEFEFIANCNVGSEFMTDEDIQKLTSIACTTWKSNFDTSLGLSHIELSRHLAEQDSPQKTEKLISDKHSHILAWEDKPSYPDNFNIKMNPLEEKNNLGELYNLSIRAGTLNEHERYLINEHSISTIKMLEALPFPEELQNIPKFASSHHETLIGNGYPRKLNADDLGICERIITICDIFEALTACDRPYKRAKKLSESLKIMKFMAQDKKIDQDIYNFFVIEKIYLTYANLYLSKEQIDVIDESDFLLK